MRRFWALAAVCVLAACGAATDTMTAPDDNASNLLIEPYAAPIKCTSATDCNTTSNLDALHATYAICTKGKCVPTGCATYYELLHGKCSPKPYFPSGPQTNVSINALTNWTLCYSDTYGDATGAISAVLTACRGKNLMLACRPTGSSTLTLLAWAPRADVLFDTGNTTSDGHVANGSNWYFNGGLSWGFADETAAIYKDSCDTEDSYLRTGTGGAHRLCWHMNENVITTGWRCGTTVVSDGTYDRLIYESR